MDKIVAYSELLYHNRILDQAHKLIASPPPVESHEAKLLRTEILAKLSELRQQTHQAAAKISRSLPITTLTEEERASVVGA